MLMRDFLELLDREVSTPYIFIEIGKEEREKTQKELERAWIKNYFESREYKENEEKEIERFELNLFRMKDMDTVGSNILVRIFLKEDIPDYEINRMKIRSLDELILSIPEEEIDDITKEFGELQEQYKNKFGELPPTAYVPYMTKEEIVETLRACIENNVKFLEFLHIGIDYNMLY